MQIPLILKLKKTRHKEIAKVQDVLVEELYHIFNKVVVHGGTAIWRCYNGNRFSEDIDAYLPKDEKKILFFFQNLEKKGFMILKKKIGVKSIYAVLQFQRTVVSFEAVFKKVDGVLKEYTTADGNFITIYTLPPEVLIKEKISAYLNRYKIRDLYDIFFLLRYVKEQDSILKPIHIFLEKFQQPVDSEELRILIIEGVVPDTKKMIQYIKDWCDYGKGKISKKT